ncbi:MAG: FliI/YscN family ATPase [Pseudomonadota bacterium]
MESLDLITGQFYRHPVVRRIGRIQSVSSTVIIVTGLSDIASIGHRVSLGMAGEINGEVVQVMPDTISVLAESDLTSLRIGEPVRYLGRLEVFPCAEWLGRLIDSTGSPLDGKALVQGHSGIPVDRTPPMAIERRALGGRISTGYALFNTLLPLVRGQRLGVFSGSGVGKSSLMAAFARDVQVDVVVIALIGERGREVNHFINSVLGQKGMKRSVVVAATSDQSPLARRQAAFTAMAVAEYFRDAGQHVLLMLDSITRLAEAHREIASSTGENLSMRGFPPSTVGLLAAFAERAGPGTSGQGDITAIFTVLVSGSDMEEPVADTLRGLLDGHVVLAREIAERGRFPAVDVVQSVSRSLPEAASEEENSLIAEARRTLSLYEDSEIMVRSGLYQPGTNPSLDHAVSAFPKLDAFAAARDDDIVSSFERLRECLENESDS